MSKHRTIAIRALALGCALIGASCVPDVDVNSNSSELRKKDDCRADQSCGEGDWGPADPPAPPQPPPPPEMVPDCRGASFPSFPSSSPYATDQATWLRGATRYAERVGAAAAYVNFHRASYGAGNVFGTIVLGTPAVAFWRDVPARSLGGLRIDDVPGLMRASQAYARAIGYNAALPTFEEGQVNGETVYGISFLSPAAIELREVDNCELGSIDPLDVEAVFRGAQAYADRNGYVGAIPTFEMRHPGNGRVIFTLILLTRVGATWIDAPEAELSFKCGDVGQDRCSYEGASGCRQGLEIDGWYWCGAPAKPIECGGEGDRCCAGQTCDGELACNYNGLFVPRTCGEKPATACGDGACTVDEACWCDRDCADAELCKPLDLCGEDGMYGMWQFCTACPSEIFGEYLTDHDVTACSEDDAREWLQSQYINCEVRDGHCE
jgi:hypothetical protein